MRYLIRICLSSLDFIHVCIKKLNFNVEVILKYFFYNFYYQVMQSQIYFLIIIFFTKKNFLIYKIYIIKIYLIFFTYFI